MLPRIFTNLANLRSRLPSSGKLNLKRENIFLFNAGNSNFFKYILINNMWINLAGMEQGPPPHLIHLAIILIKFLG